VLSILHRITGVALAGGTVLLASWLMAAAMGPEHFATAQAAAGSWIGRTLLFGWTVALFYHLCSGIRHLGWDLGLGYELPVVYGSGWAVLAATLVLSLGAWVWGYAAMGAF
jgi:succinate dehydrogenase / fumarate reductase cytochrome b subunit